MKTVKIDLDRIVRNENQPRTYFDQQSIVELAQSIKENGLIQLIVVRKINKDYQIIAGERRFRALQLLDMKNLEALVLDVDDNTMANLALVENVQRQNLSPIELARAYQNILDTQKISQSDLADTIGKSQSAIANKLRLLNLSSEVIKAINDKTISERHGRALLAVDQERQIKLLDKIIEKDLSVAQTEALVETKSRGSATRWRVSKQYQLAVNTINDSIKMVKKTGIEMDVEYKDNEENYIIEIKFKK